MVRFEDLRRIAAAVAVRPSLWATAVRQVLVLAAPGWWRRRPFLPLPDPAYLRFRLITQYGDAEHPPTPGDLVEYLRWCRAYRAAVHSAPGCDRLPSGA